MQRTFPEAVGDGPRRAALRKSSIVRYFAASLFGLFLLTVFCRRVGTLLTCVIALNSLDDYEGGGTTMEPLDPDILQEDDADRAGMCTCGAVGAAGARCIERRSRYA